MSLIALYSDRSSVAICARTRGRSPLGLPGAMRSPDKATRSSGPDARPSCFLSRAA